MVESKGSRVKIPCVSSGKERRSYLTHHSFLSSPLAEVHADPLRGKTRLLTYGSRSARKVRGLVLVAVLFAAAVLLANPVLVIVVDLLDGWPYSEDYRWTGSPGENLGASLATAEFGGGGQYEDIVMGAPRASSGVGMVYLFLGGEDLNPGVPDLTVIGDAAQPHGAIGSSVAAGDVNGDGLADIVIGCPVTSDGGRVYVLYGGFSLPDTIDLGQQPPSCLVHSGTGGDHLGAHVWVADLDMDGFDDMLLADPSADPRGRRDAGVLHVIYGRSDLPGEIFLGKGVEGWTVIGAFAYDSLGTAVAIGDLTGDGLGDVALGVPASDAVELNSGRTYVLYGREVFPDTLDLFVDADAHFIGGAGGDRSGTSVCIGEVRGEGGSDLLIGSPGCDLYATDGGIVSVFFGSDSFPPVTNLGANAGDIVLFSSREGDRIGEAIASGVGTYSPYVRCVAVGAPHATPDDSLSGRAGAGEVFLCNTDQWGSGEFDVSWQSLYYIIGGHPGDHVGSPLVLANSISSGGDDFLIGAPVAEGGAGEVYLVRDADITGIGDGGKGRGSGVPKAGMLEQNYPNPFNPSTTIAFYVPVNVAPVWVRLEVFSVRGSKVKTLVEGSRPTGLNEVHWDGRDDRGRPVPSGVYFYQMETDRGFRSTRKMVLLE